MNRRIESKTSRTAEFTCLIRVQSYLEKRAHFKNDDYLSLVIANSFIKLLFKIPLVKRYFLNKIYPKGMYEYVISRTKFIDIEFKKALEHGIEQILIFGAGFDTRGVRFQDISKNTRIFELDVPVTQTAKLKRFKEKGIKIPNNLVFIPIDFEHQSIAERLWDCNFEKGKKSLFILEGLTMYLKPESVDSTFNIIREFAGEGSLILFDYIYSSVLRKENLYVGEMELYQNVSKVDEKFLFGIEKGSIEEFLSKYGFKAIDVMDSDSLENVFFKDGKGKLLATVNGTHCIVSALK